MTNQEIAKIFYEISEYLEMKKVAFKPRAYEKAADSISGLQENLADIYKKEGRKGLDRIPAVGASIAEKIEELIKTGRLRYYEQLKQKTPVDLSGLSAVGGLGPNSVKILYEKLGITNLEQLEQAAKKGEISKLERFGKKKEENILRGIEFLKKSGGRFLLSVALKQARGIEERLQKIKGVKKVIAAGSVRRRKETAGDLDFLITAKKADAKRVIDFFVSMTEVVAVLAQGSTRAAVKLINGMDADLRVVLEESYGAALNYFTGSKDHNIALRKIAIKKGYKLNEYGLFKGNKLVAGKTEREIYKKLGLDYIEPEMRENVGEIEMTTLPKLIDYNDLRGDLQIQTNWSDGAHSIEEMAEEAAKIGLEYILITDHTKKLAMARGLDESRLLKQMEEIDEVNERLKKRKIKIRVLKGSECDILKDGTMDLPDRVLAKLDVVGGSIHSHFNLSEKEQTERLIKAMTNPNVDIIFHPTGRLINRRQEISLNIDEIIQAAKKTGTVLEINAFPDRLDLRDEYIRKCVMAGVKMSISSDGHSKDHFSVLEFGIAQARRGWAEKKHIINAWPLKEMLQWIKK